VSDATRSDPKPSKASMASQKTNSEVFITDQGYGMTLKPTESEFVIYDGLAGMKQIYRGSASHESTI